MSIAPDNFLAKKLSIFMSLSDAEIAQLERLQRRDKYVAAGTTLIEQGQPIDFAYVLKDGWAIRTVVLEDGRRQVLGFVLPGDIIGGAGSFISHAQQTVASLTEATVATFRPQRLLTLSRRSPRLGAAVSWAAAREESILVERIVSLGRRSAYESVAHLFLELSKRLQAVGLASGHVFELPVTQVDIGDALGLSSVHVNRTLKKLQRDGLIDLSDQVVRILDYVALRQVPAFGGRYLRHERVSSETRNTLDNL